VGSSGLLSGGIAIIGGDFGIGELIGGVPPEVPAPVRLSCLQLARITVKAHKITTPGKRKTEMPEMFMIFFSN
jgi:hypothetical protein